MFLYKILKKSTDGKIEEDFKPFVILSNLCEDGKITKNLKPFLYNILQGIADILGVLRTTIESIINDEKFKSEEIVQNSRGGKMGQDLG